MTGDESRVYGYGPETKQQSSQWEGPTSPRPKKGRQVRSKTKVMLLAFLFYSEGIVHQEYAPGGQTIKNEFYVEVLRRLRESFRRKQEKWRDSDWILQHDNAPAHTSHLVQQFLAKHGTAQLQQQQPYSPDLAPCDSFLFSRIKKVLKGQRFEVTEDIKRNSTKTSRKKSSQNVSNSGRNVG